MVPALETVRRSMHFLARHERVDVSPSSSAPSLAFATSLLVPSFSELSSPSVQCGPAVPRRLDVARMALYWRADPNGELKEFIDQGLFTRVGAAHAGNFQQARFVPCG